MVDNNKVTWLTPNIGVGSDSTIRVTMMPPLECWIGVEGYPQEPVPYVLIYNRHGNFSMGFPKDSPEGRAALARFPQRHVGWRKHYHAARRSIGVFVGTIRTKLRKSPIVKMREYGERKVAAVTSAPVPTTPPKPKPQLRPVSWLYSQGNPHGGLLLRDQSDNQYCAYSPLWGICQIGSWSQHATAPNPPMNDSVLKSVSGEFLVEDQLPERLKWRLAQN